MATLARRDDAELTRALQAWCEHARPGAAPIAELVRPTAGWTNETLLVRDHDGARFVVRLPPPLPTWRTYDLGAEAAVLRALAAQSIPVPRVLAYEPEERWLGAPFLVMSFEEGHPIGEVAALDPWLADAAPDEQRAVHVAFAVVLAAVHRVNWTSLAPAVRGARSALGAEVAYWREYIDWASDGAPARALVDAADWCARTVPATPPRSSLCWGDPRLGNVLFHDDRTIAAVLDWETASIGPAELDLGWYLALDDLAFHFVKRALPGFLDRAAFVKTYEAALGRAVVNLEWHEIFALVRSTAINDRQARLAARTGASYPGVAGDTNPVLPYIRAKIAAFEASA